MRPINLEELSRKTGIDCRFVAEFILALFVLGLFAALGSYAEASGFECRVVNKDIAVKWTQRGNVELQKSSHIGKHEYFIPLEDQPNIWVYIDATEGVHYITTLNYDKSAVLGTYVNKDHEKFIVVNMALGSDGVVTAMVSRRSAVDANGGFFLGHTTLRCWMLEDSATDDE